jgi:hypothetical protein
MRTRFAGLMLLGLLAAACTTPPPPYTVSLPGVSISFGMDMDGWAINMAQWAFADPARTQGRPVEAARAAAALEYLAVQLETPRWAGMNPLTVMEMKHARVELRQALGVAPQAPPQPVIDALLACAGALAAGDPVTATMPLRNPFFTFGAERTLAILAAMPYLRAANVATMHAAETDPGFGGSLHR